MPEIEQGHQAVLQPLYPEPEEVRKLSRRGVGTVLRADVRVDEMWSDVGKKKAVVVLLNPESRVPPDTLVVGRAGEELPAKATSPALQLLVLHASTSPVHSPALPAAPGSGSTRATDVFPS